MLLTVMIKVTHSQEEIKYLGIVNIFGTDNDASQML